MNNRLPGDLLPHYEAPPASHLAQRDQIINQIRHLAKQPNSGIMYVPFAKAFPGTAVAAIMGERIVRLVLDGYGKLRRFDPGRVGMEITVTQAIAEAKRPIV